MQLAARMSAVIFCCSEKLLNPRIFVVGVLVRYDFGEVEALRAEPQPDALGDAGVDLKRILSSGLVVRLMIPPERAKPGVSAMVSTGRPRRDSRMPVRRVASEAPVSTCRKAVGESHRIAPFGCH